MEDTFWSLVSEVSLLCKLRKHLEHLCRARVPLLIWYKMTTLQFPNNFKCPPKCSPSLPDTCSSVQKSGISVAPRCFFKCLLASLQGHRIRVLVFKACGTAAECGAGAALCQSSQVCSDTFVSQCLHMAACKCTFPSSERHSLLVCVQLPLCSFLQVSVSSFISAYTSMGLRNQLAHFL